MANKYSFEQGDSRRIHLFELKVGEAMHCVNFPFLAAVLADRNEEVRWRVATLCIWGAAVLISLVALAMQLLPARVHQTPTSVVAPSPAPATPSGKPP